MRTPHSSTPVLSAVLAALFLAACTPQLPASPESAKKQLTTLGNRALDAKDQASARIERAGSAVTSGVEATKETLTSIGDTVLTVTGNEDKIKRDDGH